VEKGMPTLRQRKGTWDDEYDNKGTLWRGVPDLDILFESGQRVLELGCGNGKTLAVLSSHDIEVVGIDFSISSLRLCQRRSSTNVDLVQANAVDLPFKDGSFHVVLCHHMLEHLYHEERRKAAEEITRVLCPNGSLHFQAFSVLDMRYGRGRPLEENTFSRGDGIIYHYFQDDEIVDLFPALHLISCQHNSIKKRYDGIETRRDRLSATLRK
jgi:SAM-dependent methyltransferase